MNKAYVIPGVFAGNAPIDFPHLDQPFRLLSVTAVLTCASPGFGDIRCPILVWTYGGVANLGFVPQAVRYWDGDVAHLTWAANLSAASAGSQPGENFKYSTVSLPDVLMDGRFRLQLNVQGADTSDTISNVAFLIDTQF